MVNELYNYFTSPQIDPNKWVNVDLKLVPKPWALSRLIWHNKRTDRLSVIEVLKEASSVHKQAEFVIKVLEIRSDPKRDPGLRTLNKLNLAFQLVRHADQKDERLKGLMAALKEQQALYFATSVDYAKLATILQELHAIPSASWSSMDRNVMGLILAHTRLEDLDSISKTCKSWNRAAHARFDKAVKDPHTGPYLASVPPALSFVRQNRRAIARRAMSKQPSVKKVMDLSVTGTWPMEAKKFISNGSYCVVQSNPKSYIFTLDGKCRVFENWYGNTNNLILEKDRLYAVYNEHAYILEIDTKTNSSTRIHQQNGLNIVISHCYANRFYALLDDMRLLEIDLATKVSSISEPLPLGDVNPQFVQDRLIYRQDPNHLVACALTNPTSRVVFDVANTLEQYVAANGVLFVRSQIPGTPIQAYSLQTGALLRQYECGDLIHSQIVIDKGMLFVTKGYSKLESYDLLTGTLVQRIERSYPSRFMPFGNVIYFCDYDQFGWGPSCLNQITFT